MNRSVSCRTTGCPSVSPMLMSYFLKNVVGVRPDSLWNSLPSASLPSRPHSGIFPKSVRPSRAHRRGEARALILTGLRCSRLRHDPRVANSGLALNTRLRMLFQPGLAVLAARMLVAGSKALLSEGSLSSFPATDLAV